MGNTFVKGTETSEEKDTDEKICRKLHKIKVKFSQLAHKIIERETSSTDTASCNLVAADVSYRLELAEQLVRRWRGCVGCRVSAAIDEHQHDNDDDDDMLCTVLVLGKTGVGKSATINSILGYNEEEEANSCTVRTDAFQVATKKIQEVVGAVLEDLNIRLIDTPGLSPCSLSSDKLHNEKILRSVKSFIKNKPPDVVLYIDRLDDFTNAGTLTDKLLLRTITKVLGPSIWMNAIVVLTHAGASPPPEVLPHDDDDINESYDHKIQNTFVGRRYGEVQKAIYQACDGWELRSTNMNLPFVLAENNRHHHYQSYSKGTANWKPHMLLLCFALKVLAEANTYLKLQQQATSHDCDAVLPPLEVPIPAEELEFLMDYGYGARERSVADDVDFVFECDDADLDKDKGQLQIDLTRHMKHTTSSLLFYMSAREGFGLYNHWLCGYTTFKNYFRREAVAGFYISRDVDDHLHHQKLLTAGFKLQNELISNKWLSLILTGGSVTRMCSRDARGGSAAVTSTKVVHGAVLHATLFPLLSVVGLYISNIDEDGGLRYCCYVNHIPGDRIVRNLTVSSRLESNGYGHLQISEKGSFPFAMAFGLLLPTVRTMHNLYQQLTTS